ncbi:MAG TPA: hypothetical protein VKY80_09545 [Croceibacterium sp.]|nr:hypothetical protein [Croceibacterium sp.]
MPAFFLALLAAAAATLAGREAVRMARLSAALGPAVPLLVAGWLACIAACALAAWLGAGIAGALLPSAKTMLVAIALLLAALELTLAKQVRTPAEPTRAFGAALLVFTAAQVAAAAGFVVFALAAALAAPWLTAVGGMVGSGAALTAAWSAGAEWTRLPLRPFRYGVALLLLVAAILTGLSARGLL